MKIIITFLLAGCVFVHAQAPRKNALSKYRQLWEKSLVTIPPDPPLPEEEKKVTLLDDYVLGGWTQTSQGYLVSLINSKSPKERLTIAPGMPNKGGYQVLEVERDPMNYKASRVLIQVGVDQKWIGYEDKFLTLQQPPAAQKNRGKQAAPQRRNPAVPPLPNANNQQAQPAKPAVRKPRVRRVPVPPKK